MDSIIESWTCQVEGDLATFFEQLHADVTTVWMYSRIGHRSPDCKPVIGDKNAYFTFTGDAGALAAITARMYRPGWLVIVIDRCRTEPEDIDPEYATWAEIGQKVTTWLRGWIRECYRVEPMPQRAGRPSWDDYDEPTTPDQGRKVESVTPEVQEEFIFDGTVEEFNGVVFSNLKSHGATGVKPEFAPGDEEILPEDVSFKIDTLPMAGNRTLLTVTTRGERGRAIWESLRAEIARLDWTINPFVEPTPNQGQPTTPDRGRQPWEAEEWYRELTLEERTRYNNLRPLKDAWEGGEITDTQLAKQFMKSADTIRGWRRDLRKKGAPDMDWRKA